MLLLIGLVFLLGACATTPSGPTVGVLPGGAMVLERLEDRRRAVRSFIMQGEIEVITPQGELYGDHLIQGIYPNRLRAEILGPFGRPLLTLASDGVWLTAIDYRNNRAYKGPAGRSSLARFLAMDLAPAEIYALITGNLPISGASGAKIKPSGVPSMALMHILGLGGSMGLSASFSPHDYRVDEAWLNHWPGGGSMVCRFADFQSAPVGVYPRKVEITDSTGRRITLINQELKINPQVSGTLFELSIPAGLPIYKLP